MKNRKSFSDQSRASKNAAEIAAELQLRFADLSKGPKRVEHLQRAEQLYLDARRGQQAREVNRRIRSIMDL